MTGPVMDPHGLAAQAAADKVRLIRQSTVNSAEICLRRGKYSTLPGRPYTSGERRAGGTAYHAGAEVFFEDCMSWHDGKITPPSDALFTEMLCMAKQSLLKEVGMHEKANGAGTFVWETSYEATAARVEMMLMAWRAQGCWPNPDLYKVTGVEQEWWAPFTEGTGRPWVSKGTIDLVLQNLETGATEFEDHKTSGKKWPQKKGGPRQSPQPGTYAWAWWRLTGEMPRKFHYGVMTYGGVFERRTFDLDERHIQATVAKTLAYLPLLELPLEAIPGNTTSNLCSERYCDNWNDCPFGRAFPD